MHHGSFALNWQRAWWKMTCLIFVTIRTCFSAMVSVFIYCTCIHLHFLFNLMQWLHINCNLQSSALHTALGLAEKSFRIWLLSCGLQSVLVRFTRAFHIYLSLKQPVRNFKGFYYINKISTEIWDDKQENILVRKKLAQNVETIISNIWR